ncbi:hypothetical protein, partial [Aeromonas salmonicida]|uniref:hypothetical protein n=2 Tax=Aeromonas salmonicida TaxID=645 RepID=UPI00223F388B
NKSYEMRKRIKVLFDSIYEQTITNFFNERARNEAHALLIINSNYNFTLSDYKKHVLKNLRASLSHYNVLSDKDYTDDSDELAYFIENDFTDLILSILSNGFDSNENAIALITYLED